MSVTFNQTAPQASSEKTLWEDPCLVVERNLVARAQGTGPNTSGPSFNFNNESSPLGALSASGGGICG